MNESTHDKTLYYPKGEVLMNMSFFLVGRGGHGVTHPGNKMTRTIIATKQAEYQNLELIKRGRVIQHLMEKELRDITFVIPRDEVLRRLKAYAEGNANFRHRHDRKWQSLLFLHNSFEQIASYPAGVCIEISDKWKHEIISHLLRGAQVDSDVYSMFPELFAQVDSDVYSMFPELFPEEAGVKVSPRLVLARQNIDMAIPPMVSEKTAQPLPVTNADYSQELKCWSTTGHCKDEEMGKLHGFQHNIDMAVPPILLDTAAIAWQKPKHRNKLKPTVQRPLEEIEEWHVLTSNSNLFFDGSAYQDMTKVQTCAH